VGGKSVIFIFTNVSSEKELQREQVMKNYTHIMYTSISHELRTPINAINNSLKALKPFVDEIAMQEF
jgi:signal transduction histidine kinase